MVANRRNELIKLFSRDTSEGCRGSDGDKAVDTWREKHAERCEDPGSLIYIG